MEKNKSKSRATESDFESQELNQNAQVSEENSTINLKEREDKMDAVSKTSNGSLENTNNNSIESENKMENLRNVSRSEIRRKRFVYYGAKRSVDSKETKRDSIMKAIKTGRKERVKKNKATGEQEIIVVKLTPAQITDEKLKLAEITLELEKATDDLKRKDFGFSSATKTKTGNVMNKKQAYRAKKADDKIADVKALVNSAVVNSGLQNVLDLQKLAGEGGKINNVKSGLMKIVRKENKTGYPIKNVSHNTVEIIMAGLLNWDTETSDLPFDIS